MKPNILFVDDEVFILDGLKRALYSMRKDWDMHFAPSGSDALKFLEDTRCDVVVSDMLMPGMSGADLLERIMQAYPKMIRFILSGHSHSELTLRCVNFTHQFLSKPLDVVELKEKLSLILTRGALRPSRLHEMMTKVDSLPSAPSLYQTIVAASNDPDVQIDDISRIIERDIAMTASILKLVNSSFFGLRHKITCAADATSYLGLDTIRSLVLGIGVFSSFKSGDANEKAMETLWAHSLQIALAAQKIAQMETKDKKIAADCFAAGLLHDVGQLFLATHFPEDVDLVRQHSESEHISNLQAEKQVLGTDHTEIGSSLLCRWGLPTSLMDVAAFHHSPGKYEKREFSPVLAVHVADGLAHAESSAHAFCREKLDTELLEALGFAHKLTEWKKLFSLD
jgi:HD-like signal output (HDOD) protein